MKRTSLLYVIMFITIILASVACNKYADSLLVNEPAKTVIDPDNKPSTNRYKVSKEVALKELMGTLKAIYNPKDLRSATNLNERIRQLELMDSADIQSVTAPSNNSIRSASNSEAYELMYLVNFEADGGYAILSADSRIPETVLAIVDNGHITPNDFDTLGLFMTEEERQKEIENFKYFDEEEQDYYVGEQSGSRRPNSYLMSYAMDRIDEYDGGGGGSYPTTYTKVGEWKIKEEITALLDTKWHQGYPFNDLCPDRRRFLNIFGHKKKAPAGCVPLAVAQIMAYHEYPTHFTYNGIYVDWKEVKKVWNYKYYDTNDSHNLMAAALLKGIGTWTNIHYGYSGSMGLPSKAKKYLAFCGYRNVSKHCGKNTDKTIEMLRKKKPVFMAGAAGLGGHAWVIDGYKTKTREIETISRNTGAVISKRVEEETLLHCNWGWGGTADGYYIAGTFNTRRGPSEFDSKDNSKSDTASSNFKWLFSIITYDR